MLVSSHCYHYHLFSIKMFTITSRIKYYFQFTRSQIRGESRNFQNYVKSLLSLILSPFRSVALPCHMLLISTSRQGWRTAKYNFSNLNANPVQICSHFIAIKLDPHSINQIQIAFNLKKIIILSKRHSPKISNAINGRLVHTLANERHAPDTEAKDCRKLAINETQ